MILIHNMDMSILLFLILAHKYCAIIDCEIEALDHDKYLVDGPNAVGQHYLKIIMILIISAQEDDQNIKKF